MNEKIRELLHAGSQAPSGDNCQPWKFRIFGEGRKIELRIVPERDQSLYSYNQLPSMIAAGAVLENMRVASGGLGLELDWDLFPDPANPDVVAVITTQSTAVRRNSLEQAIWDRCTNRKRYDGRKLERSIKSALNHVESEYCRTGLALVEDAEIKNSLAAAVSQNERILFENQPMHDFFYNHINWSVAENQIKKIGFFIDTLEIPAVPRLVFNVLKNWRFLNIFNKIVPFSKLIAFQNAVTYKSASAFGAILVNGNSRLDFVRAGMRMQRVWLEVAAAGLSLQPMTGIIFLIQRILAGDTEQIDNKHKQSIEQAYKTISQSFGAKNKTIAMVFRIGYGGNPSGRSVRFGVEDTIERAV